MGFIAAIILFPLILWALSLGCGLLVERITGARLPALLILPLGFGLLIVVSQFTTWWAPLAPWTPWVLLVLALLGLVLSRNQIAERWARRPHGWWWGFGAGLAAYVIAALAVIAAGRLTFTGYLLDTTGALQVAGGVRLLHHGHNFTNGLPGYGSTLEAYFGHGYPSGGQGALAAVGWLSGQNALWLYSIFQDLELGMAALVFAFLARRAGLGRPAAAITATVAAVPALVYAYALMGSIKELTALPMLVMFGALLVCARELRRQAGWRAVLPFAVAAAAALASIGIAAAAWVLPFGAAVLLAATPGAWSGARARRSEVPRLALGGAWLAVSTAIIALPTVGRISKTLSVAESVTNANASAVNDPGNLLRPLKFVQVLGVWLGESHRVEPRLLSLTYLVMGVVAVCIALGLIWLIRRRSWTVLGFVAISLLVWGILHTQATDWTNAKILMLLSPVIVFTAMLGAFAVAKRMRWEGAVLVAVVAGGVLASDALLYHATNLAPTRSFEEMRAIDARFANRGPTLDPEFNEYTLYLLRKMGPDIPGLAYPGPFTFVGGAARSYGHSYDLDQIALASVEQYPMIVQRRSPQRSRPPGNYKQVWNGPYYTAWRRVGPSPIAHFPLGSGFTPSAIPRCSEVRRIAQQARRDHARIAFAPRPINVSANLAAAKYSPNVIPSTDLEGRPQLNFAGPARVTGTLDVKSSDTYEVWLGGSVDRPLRVLIGGHVIGAPSQESGDDGNVIHVGTVRLRAGRHAYELVRGGGNLGPDDNLSTGIDGVVLQQVGAAQEPVLSIPASRWRSLCHRPLDWIEIG